MTLVMDLNVRNIKKGMKMLDLSIGDFVGLIGLKAWTSLVFKTPVGNPDLWASPAPSGYVGGQAKFSWNMQYNKPDSTQPNTWSPSGQPSTPRIKWIDPYDVLYVTSSIPYMKRLEDGWSSQSSHMIKRTVSEIDLELKTALR